MGKDNVPFHTLSAFSSSILSFNIFVQCKVYLLTKIFQVVFPSTLLGTDENWTLMKTISVTEYLNYETCMFSKSKGVGVFGNDAKDRNIHVEVWRYYLLTNMPEVQQFFIISLTV
ncbi:putative methionine--tRNA ligase [Helianthus anomalus]